MLLFHMIFAVHTFNSSVFFAIKNCAILYYRVAIDAFFFHSLLVLLCHWAFFYACMHFDRFNQINNNPMHSLRALARPCAVFCYAFFSRTLKKSESFFTVVLVLWNAFWVFSTYTRASKYGAYLFIVRLCSLANRMRGKMIFCVWRSKKEMI